jgi:hypothetical protein
MQRWVNILIALALTGLIASCWVTCDAQTVINRRTVAAASIAYDSSSQGDQGSGATLTVAHVVAADANWLEVGVTSYLSGGAQTVGVTYNGSAMTARTAQGGEDKLQTFYLASPTTGTHNIVVTPSSSSCEIAMAAISLKNVSSTSGPNNETAAASDWTNTVTCSTGNWAVVFVRYYNQTPTVTNGTLRVNNNNTSSQGSVMALTKASTGSTVTIDGAGMAGSTWHSNGASVDK